MKKLILAAAAMATLGAGMAAAETVQVYNGAAANVAVTFKDDDGNVLGQRTLHAGQSMKVTYPTYEKEDGSTGIKGGTVNMFLPDAWFNPSNTDVRVTADDGGWKFIDISGFNEYITANVRDL